eukprot:1557117-Rhodomonas_salina.1
MSPSNSTLYNATHNPSRRSTTQTTHFQDQYYTSANNATRPTNSPYASNNPMLEQQPRRRSITTQPTSTERQTARPNTQAIQLQDQYNTSVNNTRFPTNSPYASNRPRRHPSAAGQLQDPPVLSPYASNTTRRFQQSGIRSITPQPRIAQESTQPSRAARQTPTRTSAGRQTARPTTPATVERQRTPPFTNNAAAARPQSTSNINRLSQPRNHTVKHSHMTLEWLSNRYPNLNEKELKRRLQELKTKFQ